MVFGMQGRGPVHILKEVWTGDQVIPANLKKTTVDYLYELKTRLKIAADIALGNVEIMQSISTNQYNQHSKKKEFKSGDQVIIFERDSTNKVESQ